MGPLVRIRLREISACTTFFQELWPSSFTPSDVRRPRGPGFFFAMATYEIYADEAWTHGGEPPNRYHCFFGGIFGETSSLDRLDTELRSTMARHRLERGPGAAPHRPAEVKWKHLSANNHALYRDLVHVLSRYLEAGQVRYRQLFCDRALVRVGNEYDEKRSHVDVQFRICYQFLKHSFGIEHLPPATSTEPHTILARFDTFSSQRHKEDLIRFGAGIPRMLGRDDIELKVTFVDSAKTPRIQICDILMGAAGSHGNKMSLRRKDGRIGMTDAQKLRNSLALLVYNELRRISQAERGTKAFNWFESTGRSGDAANSLNHAIRIWKFKPAVYRVDKGWENDALDKFGCFVASQLDVAVQTNLEDGEDEDWVTARK
jgi:hypothetical protein